MLRVSDLKKMAIWIPDSALRAIRRYFMCVISDPDSASRAGLTDCTILNPGP